MVNKGRDMSQKATKPTEAEVRKNKSSKNIKRDEAGKFTSGSGSLNSVKSFNWSRALPIIFVVALVGGFFVFKSFASGSRAEVTKWYRTCLNKEPDSGGLNYWAGRLDKGEHAWAVADAFMKSSGATSCNYPNESKIKTPAATPVGVKPATPVTTSGTGSSAKPVTPVGSSSTSIARQIINSFYAACSYSAIPTYDNGGYQFWLKKLNDKVTNFNDAPSVNSVWKEFKQVSETNGLRCSSSYTTTQNTAPVTNPTQIKGPNQGKQPQTNNTTNNNAGKQQRLIEMQAWERLTKAYLTNAKAARVRTEAIANKTRVSDSEFMTIQGAVNHYYAAVNSVFVPLQKLNRYRNDALNDKGNVTSNQIVTSFNNYYRDAHELSKVQKQIVSDWERALPKSNYKKIY